MNGRKTKQLKRQLVEMTGGDFTKGMWRRFKKLYKESRR